MNQPTKPENDCPNSGGNVTADELTQIRDSLRGLRFGSVHITVQDGLIVQIDRTEISFDRRAHNPILREAQLDKDCPPIPWLANHRVQFVYT